MPDMGNANTCATASCQNRLFTLEHPFEFASAIWQTLVLCCQRSYIPILGKCEAAQRPSWPAGPMKRSREESEGEAEAGAGRRDSAADAEARLDSEDDDAPLFTTSKASKTVRSGAECPYLDTISRKVRALLCRTRHNMMHFCDAFDLHMCHPLSPPPSRTWTLTLKSAARCR